MSNPLTITAEPDLPFIDGTREFDAPLGAVWRAYTEPELLAQWMGPRDLTIQDLQFDARTGGSWSYTHRAGDGTEYRFRGVLHSVVDHQSITQTFEFAGVPGHVSLETATFEELGDRTRLRVHSVFQSVEDRDGMVASGMEGGMSQSYERLDDLLAAQG
ncbi:MAG: SRPBCC family protein [Nocardioidaceae bacterium]